jgi:flagellar motor switch protein FliN/FliY
MANEQHTTYPFLERFLARWANELSRAIESQTGQAPAISHASVPDSRSWEERASNVLWWKQTTEGIDNFAIWIGAEEDCWSALAGTSKLGGEPRQVYFELLKQVNRNLAGAAATGFSKPFRWRDGSMEQTTPALDTLELIEVQITLDGKILPSLLAGVERQAQALEPGASGSEISTLPATSASPMLSRLMDLQLPVTVLLGRAVLPIRDVLKISSGSLIELDRQIDDYVEVMVHGTVVARGEIVSVRGNYGVRIKEIISRQDRIALRDAA